MQFLQIIEIITDRIEELLAFEDEWRVAARGRKTGTADWLGADRERPGRYFSVNLFPSLEAADANGALPETNALAEQAMQLGSATFYNCDVIHDVWGDELDGQADQLAGMFATAQVPHDLFADDVVIELNFPHSRGRLDGIAAVRSSVPVMLEPATVGEQRVVPMLAGFVLECTLTTNGVSQRQACIAQTAGGLVRHVAVYCTGDL
ncbi:MAG TPA: hypothetical protein VEP49_18760 [Acidimicrobiia bacterium]|nr:hypothetical protein [Acidimicrobiia bacterium]